MVVIQIAFFTTQLDAYPTQFQQVNQESKSHSHSDVVTTSTHQITEILQKAIPYEDPIWYANMVREANKRAANGEHLKLSNKALLHYKKMYKIKYK